MTDGWFPRLNGIGNVVSGASGITVNGTVLAQGGHPQWKTDETIAYIGAGDCVYTVPAWGGQPSRFSERAVSFFGAGYGTIVLPGPGVIGLSVDPVNGNVAALLEHGGNLDRSITVNTLSVVAHQPVSDIRMLDALLVWSRWTGAPHDRGTVGVDLRVEPWAPIDLRVFDAGWEGAPVPFRTPEGPWVLVQTNTDLRLHPWGSSLGYLIPTGEDENLYPDARFVDGQISVVWTTARGELRGMAFALTDPRVNVGAPVPQPPEPIGPRGPARPEDGTVYDLTASLVGDPATWPRVGPTHPMHQSAGAPGIVHSVKFGDIDPSGSSYETHATDANWDYLLEDANGCYSFSDPRWQPLRMPIGEAHAFDTGEHETIYRRREDCVVLARMPNRRRHWLHAVYDRWYWGPDLGERRTDVCVYDPTAGIHAADRLIEVNYYALGAGWARWEAHRSDLVYASGARAVFSDATRVARSDFYLVGGPAVRPTLTGCVAQVVPHYPAWDPKPPTPPVEDEMIAYGTPAPGFLPGDEHDNGNGTLSVRKPNGKWLCVTPDGGIEERDDPGGPWESFKRGKNGSSLVAERGDRVFVLPRAEF